MYNLFLVTFALIFISHLDFAVMDGKMMGGGMGFVLISPNKPDPLGQHPGDTLIFNSKCGTGIIKDGGAKGKSILALPQCKVIKKKKIVKKVFMPMMDMHGMGSANVETVVKVNATPETKEPAVETNSSADDMSSMRSQFMSRVGRRMQFVAQQRD